MSMKKQKNFLDPLFSSDEEEDIGTTSSSDNKDYTGKDKEDMVTLSQIYKRQNKSSPTATNNPNSSSKVALVSTEGSTSKKRQLFDNTSNFHARKRAKELQANLEPRFSSWVKSMSETHVDRRFKLGIPEPICTSHFPKRNIVIDLVDEYQDEYQVQYSVKEMALIRGWKDFALAHELVKGDVLVFQFVKPTEIKVYVIRAYAMAETDGVMTMSINNSDARAEKVRPQLEDQRVVRELAQLLDSYDSYKLRSGELESQDKCAAPTISERFMGMRAAILTNNSSVKSFANYLGFTVLQFDELVKKNQPPELPVSEVLKLLGFQDEKTSETCDFDLLFVHIASDGKDIPLELNGNEIELINGLVGGVLQIANHGSDIASRLLLSLVMSYGGLAEGEDADLLDLTLQKESNPDLSKLFPRQSYIMKGANVVDNIRHHCPMLIAQWQDAVTRKDMADIFSFKEFKEHGANLAIPAERFLHEVAFKLWKAPKYGA